MTDQSETGDRVIRLRGPRQLLTPQEVRDLLGVSRTTVHERTEAGQLEAERTLGGHRRYPADQPALQAALDAQRLEARLQPWYDQ